MSDDTRFTVDDFFRECSEFRKAFTTKSFWSLPETAREAATRGLLFAYTHTSPTAEYSQDRLATVLQALLQEFLWREAYMVRGLPRSVT